MTSRRLSLFESAFFAIVFASVLVCSIGPISKAFRFSGSWLFLWPLLFWIVRLLSFSVLPLIALVFAWVSRRDNRTTRLFAIGNLLACALLVGVILAIQHWTRNDAKNEFEKQSSGMTPAEILESSSKGRTLPKIILKELDGQELSLIKQVQSAKATAIVFWASYDQKWSGIMKLAAAVSRDFHAQDFQVIGVNEGEPPETARAYINSQNIEFQNVTDLKGDFFKECGLWGGIEQIILVDRNGIILDVFKRVGDNENFVRQAISKQLAN